MAPVANDIIRVAARQLRNGNDEVVNVFHFKIAAAGAGGDSALRTEVAAKLANAWLELQSSIANDIEPNTLDVYNVTQDVPLGQVPWEGAYTGGTGAGSQAPAQDALLVLFLTGAKRVQGKAYLGGLVIGAIGDGVWAGTVLTQAAAWFTVMNDPTPVDDDWGLQLGVYSRGSGIFHTITGRRIVSNPATQRRRRLGRGS